MAMITKTLREWRTRENLYSPEAVTAEEFEAGVDAVPESYMPGSHAETMFLVGFAAARRGERQAPDYSLWTGGAAAAAAVGFKAGRFGRPAESGSTAPLSAPVPDGTMPTKGR